MSDEPYTLGAWRAKSGKEDELIEAWRELAGFIVSLPNPGGRGLLLQSIDDPQQFYSFGPWPSLEAIQQFRNHPETPKAISKLMNLCHEARPGTFRIAATS